MKQAIAPRSPAEILSLINEATAASTGQQYFDALVRNVATALSVHCVFIARFSDDLGTAEVRAFWLGAGLIEPFSYTLPGTPCEVVLAGEVVSIESEVADRFPDHRRELEEISSQSYLAIPLLAEQGAVVGHLAVIDTVERRWQDTDIGTLRLFAMRATAEFDRESYQRSLEKANAALEDKVARRTTELTAALAELSALKDRLQAENRYLQSEISEHTNFRNIVGGSPALREVLRRIDLVARTDSTVLILGETGTGKELIARAIHDRSARQSRPLVKLNCCAISAGLVESELFGHVKGAFTGASERRSGRFELADGGTLFLDELGELPLETQAKLLRVLQEGEFDPVGSSKTQRVDVRVIAATNRDLAADVAAGRFRADLYYRLNVFPINVPALRERREDIPLLARHFLGLASRRVGRAYTAIEPQSLALLATHDWPGNIRDLQNTIERAAILSQPPLLRVEEPLASAVGTMPKGTAVVATPATPAGHSLEDVERQHIIAVLRRTRGVVEGPNGAAGILGLKPSTARFRMRKLGIRKSDLSHG